MITNPNTTHNSAALVREYLDWQRDVRRRSPHTIYQYEGVLDRWLSWLGAMPLSEAGASDVEAFANRPRKRRNGGRQGAPSAATVAADLAVVSGLYRYLAERYSVHNPAALAGRPRVDNKLPRPISPDTWLQVWRTESLDVHARTALGLMFFCGFRRSEVVALRRDNLTTDGKIENFVRKGGGTDTFNVVEMVEHWEWKQPSWGAARFYEALQTSASTEGAEWLFPWPTHPLSGCVEPSSLTARLRTWLHASGLPRDAFTPHALRHSFVTYLLDSGVPIHVVSALANHNNPAITMRYARVAGRLGMFKRENTRYGTKAQ